MTQRRTKARRAAFSGRRSPPLAAASPNAFPLLAAQVLRKLEASLAEGQFYEAHEQCKTVYHRLRARRQAEDSYTLCTVRRSCWWLPALSPKHTVAAALLHFGFPFLCYGCWALLIGGPEGVTPRTVLTLSVLHTSHALVAAYRRARACSCSAAS